MNCISTLNTTLNIFVIQQHVAALEPIASTSGTQQNPVASTSRAPDIVEFPLDLSRRSRTSQDNSNPSPSLLCYEVGYYSEPVKSPIHFYSVILLLFQCTLLVLFSFVFNRTYNPVHLLTPHSVRSALKTNVVHVFGSTS